MSAETPRPGNPLPELTIIDATLADRPEPAIPDRVTAKHGTGLGLLVGMLLALFVLGGGAVVMLVLLGIGAWYVHDQRIQEEVRADAVRIDKNLLPADRPANAPTVAPVAPEAPSEPATIVPKLQDPVEVATNTVAGLATVSTGGSRRYTFQPDLDYTYQFQARTEIEKTKVSYFGAVNYKLNAGLTADAASATAMTAAEQVRLGSAFVVHAEGLLATSARLIRDSAEIQVTLGGKVYRGEAVAIDDRSDIALVRIAATGLSALALSDSKEAIQGEKVRALGCPTSEAKSGNVRVLSGVIEGLITHGEDRVLQLGIAYNSGNVGGPLVNERGEVIGIGTGTLVGEHNATLSFAVPADYARDLMRDRGLVPSNPQPGAKVATPESIATSVAMVRVTPAKTDDSLRMLDFWGFSAANSFDRQRLVEAGEKLDFDHEDRDGHIWLSPSGLVFVSSTSSNVPLLSTTLGEIAFEDLPLPGWKRWGHNTLRRVGISTTPERHGSPLRAAQKSTEPYNFKPVVGRRPDGKERVAILPAFEMVRYRVKLETDETLELAKTYYLESLSRNKRGRVKVTGEGTVVWDKKQGVLKSSKQTFSIIEETRGYNVVTPLELDVTFKGARTEVDFALEVKAGVDAETKRTFPTRPPQEINPIANPFEKRLDEVLAKLNKVKGLDALPVVLDLASIQPIPSRRGEVAAALDQILLAGEDVTRLEAIRVARRWKTRENVPALQSIAESKTSLARNAALEALGELSQSPEQAELLAKRMANSSERYDAVNGLKAMGPIAEEAVWQHLGSKDILLNLSACDVLARIGTEKSLDRLSLVFDSISSNQAGHVAMALYSIDDRVNGPVDRMEMESLTPAERVEKFIARAKAKDKTILELKKTMRYLEGVAPIPYLREEVARLLDEMMLSEKRGFTHFPRPSVVEWGIKDNLPTIIKLLETASPFERTRLLQAVEKIGGPEAAPAVPLLVKFLGEESKEAKREHVLAALGSIPVPEAAAALTARLGDKADRTDAVKALQKLGPVAEDATLALLDSPDDAVFFAACDLLAKIGTDKSLKKLPTYRTTTNVDRDAKVSQAAGELEKRLGSP